MEYDLLKSLEGAICFQKMIEKQIKTSIDLYRCGVNNTIYSAFLLNGCDNYVLGLKNGLVLTFYDHDNDFIRFKITAGDKDKRIMKGNIKLIFDNPTFGYEDKLCYNDHMEISDLEVLQSKWELVSKLINPDNILLL